MSGISLGIRYDVDPIPPEPASTRYLDAGPLRVGVEFRHLTDDVLDAGFAGEAAKAIIDEARPEAIDDQGFSIHVMDTATGGEHLRFDMFDGDPHYHYIVPGSHNILIPFDENAFGDMLDWAIECLRSRLPAMLRFAEVPELAEQVDQDKVDAVIPEIVALVAPGRGGR
jgi:hypothetical protein